MKTELVKMPHKRNGDRLPASLSSTAELILNCAHTQIDDLQIERIKNLVQEIHDWDALIQLADQHRIAPLLYTQLNTICPNSVPNHIRYRLRDLFFANAQRNLKLTQELLKILRLLQEQDILAVPYKGPVLAALAYGNVALRQFIDLDILIQPEHVLEVKKLLLHQGYRPKEMFTAAAELAFLQSKAEHCYTFVQEAQGVVLELHWRMTPEYTSPMQLKHFLDQLESCSLAGQPIAYLSWEDWLPVLCLHGSRHCWERLIWICDIAEILRTHPNLNWQHTLQQADRFGCKRMTLLGVYLAHQFLGATLPNSVLQQAEAVPDIQSIASDIYQQLFKGSPIASKFLGRTRYHLKTRERLQDKALYVQSFFRWLVKVRK